MIRFWFIYIFLLCLLGACFDSKKENRSTLSTDTVKAINTFVPEYLVAIPQLNLSANDYYEYKFEKYVVNGSVDSANLKQGYWKIQDVKKKLIYQGTYVNDLLDGWWEVISGKSLICAGHYKRNKKQGYWRFLQVGLKKSSKYVNYKNDLLSGLAQEYTLDSSLISIGNYTNGMKNGYWKFYSDIGVLKEQGDFYDDYKSGWWQSYDDNGKILQEANYSKDEITGYTINYLNGIISEEGKQLNGKNWGIWKYYDSKGNLLKIEEFDDY